MQRSVGRKDIGPVVRRTVYSSKTGDETARLFDQKGARSGHVPYAPRRRLHDGKATIGQDVSIRASAICRRLKQLLMRQ